MIKKGQYVLCDPGLRYCPAHRPPIRVQRVRSVVIPWRAIRAALKRKDKP